MSLGYGGVCRKALEDEETVIYTYRGENLNLTRGKRERVEAIEGCSRSRSQPSRSRRYTRGS